MATETLRPNAAGDESTLAWSGADARWGCVDETPHDGDDSYVYCFGTTYNRDLYNLPAHSVGSETINFIKVYIVCRATVDGNAKPSIKSDSTVTDGTAVTLTNSYVAYSQQWDTNPADSAAWEWADIDALQIGVALRIATGGAALCTQIYVEIDYTVVTAVPLLLLLGVGV